MIKIFTLGLTVSTLLCSTAIAEQFKLNSKIDRVTVYPQGADVQRIGTAAFTAGEHELVFEGLPATLDPLSLRIDGLSQSDVQITSVDYDVKPVEDSAREAQRLEFEKQSEILTQERQRVTQQIEDTNQQRQLLLQLVQRPIVKPTEQLEIVANDSKSLTDILSLVGVQLKETSDTLHSAQLRIMAIDKLITELSNKMQGEGPEAAETATVTVHVLAAQQAQGDVKLQYRIQEASWSPQYDAKLVIPKTGVAAQVQLVRRAVVNQSSTETWDDVALTLSTSRPSGSTAAPDLEEELLATQTEALGRMQNLEQAAPAALAFEDDAAADKPKKVMKERTAVVSEVGFQAVYDVQGRVSVSNAGKAKKVGIASEQVDVELSVLATPRRDTAAYLNADFKLGESSTLLPGPVSLYRDGVYVGQNNLPLLVAGEDVSLGFGVDDLVRVTRKEIKRAGAENGIISTSRTEDRAWKIDVVNLHDRAMKITVLDRMPVSTREDVVVAPLFEQTPPTDLKYKDRRGVLAWRFPLESKAKNSITTGYRVTWPEAVKISVVD